MGLRDTAEQLDACRQQSMADERRIAVLERQAAELEAENVRLESALAARLRQDRHGVAQVEADLADARERLARIGRRVDPRIGDLTPITPADVRAILDEVYSGERLAIIAPEIADPAASALRILAALIRNLPAIPAEQLDTIADTLAPGTA